MEVLFKQENDNVRLIFSNKKSNGDFIVATFLTTTLFLELIVQSWKTASPIAETLTVHHEDLQQTLFYGSSGYIGALAGCGTRVSVTLSQQDMQDLREKLSLMSADNQAN